MIVNLNMRVRVKLTERGREIEEQVLRDLYAGVIQNGVTLKKYVKKGLHPTEADGMSCWMLWELMQYFGSHMVMGMSDQIFEDNNLVL
jgi:hypothetical protein